MVSGQNDRINPGRIACLPVQLHRPQWCPAKMTGLILCVADRDGTGGSLNGVRPK